MGTSKTDSGSNRKQPADERHGRRQSEYIPEFCTETGRCAAAGYLYDGMPGSRQVQSRLQRQRRPLSRRSIVFDHKRPYFMRQASVSCL